MKRNRFALVIAVAAVITAIVLSACGSTPDADAEEVASSLSSQGFVVSEVEIANDGYVLAVLEADNCLFRQPVMRSPESSNEWAIYAYRADLTRAGLAPKDLTYEAASDPDPLAFKPNAVNCG